MNIHSIKEKLQFRGTIKFMCIMIFLMSIGEGMTAPAIPLFGNKLGASYAQLGFLMTGYAITYTIMSLTSGILSDKIGRKNILLTGLGIAIVAAAGYYYSTTPLMLLIFRVMEGMSRGILWPTSEAIIADNSTIKTRSMAMGTFTTAYGAGATIGTLSGGFVMEYFGLTAVFPIYPLMGVIVFVTSLIGVKENKHNSEHKVAIKLFDNAFWQELKNIWPVYYAGFCYCGFLYSIWGLLSLVADSFNITSKGIGSLFAFFWGTRLIMFITSGYIAKKIGKKKSLLIGISFTILSLSNFLIANNYLLLSTATITAGIGMGISFPAIITLVTDLASKGNKGLGTGLLEFFMGIGMIINTAISSLLGETRGVHSTYLFTFIAHVGALIIYFIFIKNKKID